MCLRRLSEAVRHAELRGWRLDGRKVRQAFRACSPKSRRMLQVASAAVGIVFSAGLGGLFFAVQRKMRTVPEVASKQAAASEAVRAFISAVEKYVPRHVVEAVAADPTPENLRDCFLLARQKVNIPPNVLARLFPPGSSERRALLLAEAEDITLTGGR